MPKTNELRALYESGTYKDVITLTDKWVWGSEVYDSEASNFPFGAGFRSWFKLSDSYFRRALPVRNTK